MTRQPNKMTAGLTRKQVSRAKREARIQQWILIITGITIAIVAGVLIFAVVNEQVLTPGRIIATVNDDKITVAQFQNQVTFEWYTQLGGQHPSTYGIDGETFSEFILEAMINNLLIEQKATEKGIAISDADVEEQIQLTFGYDAGEPEPTPTATTEKPEVLPTATSTFVYTLTPRPTMTLEPGVTPSSTPTHTMTPSGKETPTQTPSPWPTATPLTEQAFNNTLTEYVTYLSKASLLSFETVKELSYQQARSQLLRQKLTEALDIKADEAKIMIHAAHILVTSEEEIKNIQSRLNNGEKFEVLAAELSQDTSNAYKGGDLGWFGPNQMDPAFEEMAKTTPIGKTSEPVQTQYGWHIIKVYGQENVETTPQEQENQRQTKFTETLEQWREEGNVVIEDFWEAYIPLQLQSPTPTLLP